MKDTFMFAKSTDPLPADSPDKLMRVNSSADVTTDDKKIADSFLCDEEESQFDELNLSTLNSRHKYGLVRTKLVSECMETVFKSFGRIMSNSVIITGVSSCGKTALVESIAYEIAVKGDKCPKCFYDNTVVVQIYPKCMPNKSDEIIGYLFDILVTFKEKGAENFILVFDELLYFPVTFLNECAYVLKELKHKLQVGMVKFISTMKHSCILLMEFWVVRKLIM